MPLVIVDHLQRRPRPTAASTTTARSPWPAWVSTTSPETSAARCWPFLGQSQSSTRPSLDAFKGSGDLEYDADAGLLLRVAAQSEEEAKSIAATQPVIPVELHAVKNRYQPPSAGAPACSSSTGATVPSASSAAYPCPRRPQLHGAGVNPPPLQLLDP